MIISLAFCRMIGDGRFGGGTGNRHGNDESQNQSGGKYISHANEKYRLRVWKEGDFSEQAILKSRTTEAQRGKIIF